MPLLSITKVGDAGIHIIVIPAAFSPREGGEGIHWFSNQTWIPAEARLECLNRGRG
jgi:hypothetical protein